MLIGNGQFFLADCLDVLASMPKESVDLIVTDPAYRVISGGVGQTSGWQGKEIGQIFHQNNGKLFNHNNIKISDYLPLMFRVLKPASHCYIMTNNLNLRELLNEAGKVGFGFHNLLVWRKNNANANRWYMKTCEWVVFLYKKPARTINNPSSKQVFEFDNPTKKLHPTQKPVELMQHYIENSSNVGDLVLDPFAGSGTTALAAQLSGRRWVTIESDPIHYYAAVGRLWGACQS